MNPFAAQRGQVEQTWDTVAEKVADSTKHLTKKQGKIELSGHALRVFLAKQMGMDSKFCSWKTKLQEESTKSGQAGMLSNHDTVEYQLLDQLAAMKQQTAEESAALSEGKALLKSIKDDQLNDEIFKKCMKSEPAKKELFRVLNKKRKVLEIKIDALAKARKESRQEVLSYLDPEERLTLEKHEELKAERRLSNQTTTDNYDSDENANRGIGKKARFHETNAAVQQLMSKVAEQPSETALERALTQWLTHKMQMQMQTRSEGASVQERLTSLESMKERRLVKEDEYTTQRKRILDSL